jgi:hypothetical protein
MGYNSHKPYSRISGCWVRLGQVLQHLTKLFFYRNSGLKAPDFEPWG